MNKNKKNNMANGINRKTTQKEVLENKMKVLDFQVNNRKRKLKRKKILKEYVYKCK